MARVLPMARPRPQQQLPPQHLGIPSPPTSRLAEAAGVVNLINAIAQSPIGGMVATGGMNLVHAMRERAIQGRLGGESTVAPPQPQGAPSVPTEAAAPPPAVSMPAPTPQPLQGLVAPGVTAETEEFGPTEGTPTAPPAAPLHQPAPLSAASMPPGASGGLAAEAQQALASGAHPAMVRAWLEKELQAQRLPPSAAERIMAGQVGTGATYGHRTTLGGYMPNTLQLLTQGVPPPPPRPEISPFIPAANAALSGIYDTASQVATEAQPLTPQAPPPTPELAAPSLSSPGPFRLAPVGARAEDLSLENESPAMQAAVGKAGEAIAAGVAPEKIVQALTQRGLNEVVAQRVADLAMQSAQPQQTPGPAGIAQPSRPLHTPEEERAFQQGVAAADSFGQVAKLARLADTSDRQGDVIMLAESMARPQTIADWASGGYKRAAIAQIVTLFPTRPKVSPEQSAADVELTQSKAGLNWAKAGEAPFRNTGALVGMAGAVGAEGRAVENQPLVAAGLKGKESRAAAGNLREEEKLPHQIDLMDAQAWRARHPQQSSAYAMWWANRKVTDLKDAKASAGAVLDDIATTEKGKRDKFLGTAQQGMAARREPKGPTESTRTSYRPRITQAGLDVTNAELAAKDSDTTIAAVQASAAAVAAARSVEEVNAALAPYLGTGGGQTRRDNRQDQNVTDLDQPSQGGAASDLDRLGL